MFTIMNNAPAAIGDFFTEVCGFQNWFIGCGAALISSCARVKAMRLHKCEPRFGELPNKCSARERGRVVLPDDGGRVFENTRGKKC